MSAFVSGDYIYRGIPGKKYKFKFRGVMSEHVFEEFASASGMKVRRTYYGGNEITALHDSRGCRCVYETETGSLFTNDTAVLGASHISGGSMARLSALCEKYGVDTIISEIGEDGDEPASVREVVLAFIRRLEGYIVRAKELHWGAETKNRHEFIDELGDKICDFEDSIAEDLMGFLGVRIGIGEAAPDIPDCESIEEFVDGLRSETSAFYLAVKDDANCTGVVSEVESFIHELNKENYLNDLL